MKRRQAGRIHNRLFRLPLLPVSFLRQLLPGGHGGEEIPVPIPNTEVKLPCADDTAYQAGK